MSLWLFSRPNGWEQPEKEAICHLVAFRRTSPTDRRPDAALFSRGGELAPRGHTMTPSWPSQERLASRGCMWVAVAVREPQGNGNGSTARTAACRMSPGL